MLGYYYLHTNGDLIHKNAVVVDSDSSYFDSPFVKKVWKFDSDNRQDAWTIVLEALAMKAALIRIKELSVKWGLTLEDSYEFITRNHNPDELLKTGLKLFIEDVLLMTEDEFYIKLEDVHNKRKDSTNA